jgi:broad specificity phosphatase PhoE
MRDRVARGLDSVLRVHRGETAVIVCHGGVVAHSMIRWLRLEPTADGGRRARIEPANTSLTEWSIATPERDDAADDDKVDEVELVRFNDHSHLSRIRSASSAGHGPPVPVT